MNESVIHAKRVFKDLIDDFLSHEDFLSLELQCVVWRPRFVQGNLETLYTTIDVQNLGMGIGEGLAGTVAETRKISAGRFGTGSPVQHPKTIKKHGWEYYYISPVVSLRSLVGVYAVYSSSKICIPGPLLNRLNLRMEAGLLLVDNIVNAAVKDESLENSLLALETGRAAEDRFHDIKEALFMANGALGALKKNKNEKGKFDRNVGILNKQLDKSRELAEKYISESKNPNLLNLSKFDLRINVRALAKELELRSKQRGSHRLRKIDVRLQIPDEEVFINADLDRLVRAIGNVLNNAEHWVVRSPTETVRIDVSLTMDEDFCYLKIFDSGPGIVEEERAFEKGYSLRGGTGLGLSIAKRVFELHNGEIKIRSELAQWTTVELTLPLIGRK